ncbi:hypothetical protein NWF24_14795 [Variovorax paradoxus]|uniref:hypothetical protein n=1 Tax=Variovorax paradoxus TaxID=34073 RepID=UPI0021AC57A2|nr:hypothetical protein [Variovorax paradoxus]UVH60628.1 hypothetical protein NWF24_14795 [Variovorax paradoxus]
MIAGQSSALMRRPVRANKSTTIRAYREMIRDDILTIVQELDEWEPLSLSTQVDA